MGRSSLRSPTREGPAHSRDDGRIWKPIRQGLPGDEREAYVQSLAIDPSDTHVVYAGTGGFVGQGHGVYKSSDGGQTWEDLTGRLPLDKNAHVAILDTVFDPTAPETIYLLCDRAGVLVSNDGGAAWRALEKPANPNSSASLTAMTILFGPKPASLVGRERGGVWQYTPD